MRKDLQPAQILDYVVLKHVCCRGIHGTIDQIGNETFEREEGGAGYTSWYHRVRRSVGRLARAGLVEKRPQKSNPSVLVAPVGQPHRMDPREVMRRIEAPAREGSET